MLLLLFFFKQKTAYEMRISDWSSDVCSSDLADPWSQISTLRFMIHPLYGGELLVDFTGLRPRGLALAFARSLFMLAAPRGPIMVRSSLKTYANQLPSFFSYLAGTGDGINGPADLRAHHIDGFETWLSAQGKSCVHGPTYVAKVV